MTETINLKVDRSLLDPHFETYYLDNPEVSLQSIDLPNPVSEFTLSEKQLYSFLHFSAFSKDFNYLFADPFDGHCPVCYYVDSQFSVLRVAVDPVEHSIILPRRVFNLPITQFKPKDCLVSISFPSKFIVLILITRCSSVDQKDGNSSLLVASTGDRQSQSSNWTTIKSFDLGDASSFSSCCQNGDREAKQLNCPTKLIDCHFQSRDDRDELVVNLLSVAKNADEKFECLLSCVKLSKVKQSGDIEESTEWTISRLQQLTGSSYPSYIASDIDKEGELFLTIASVNQFRLTFDSNKKLDSGSDQVELNREKENLYLYCQDGSEITVQFKLPPDTERNHIRVNFGLGEMEIHARGERVFNETLWGQVEKESCTWTLDRNSSDENSVLEVTLIKKDEDLVWNQLIKGKERGSQVESPEGSTSIRQLDSLISGLSERISSTGPGYIPSITGNEACDEVSEDLVLYRFNCHQSSVTHRAYLAGHQWLFYRKVDDQSLPCFSLRHDIDALIWQPQAQGSRFHVQHIATFPALGYVQASKESKKFLNCSPDFDYSFIADSTNHIYIYKQPARCEGVVNRKAGVRPKIAKQKVINLGSELIQILGSIGFKSFLLILGPRKLISIAIDF